MESSGRKSLADFEATGNYLFHGSGFLAKILEPRQAYNYINDQQIPDGTPAIFASPFADYAIFVALMSKRNFPTGYHTSSGFEHGKLTFRANKKTLEQLLNTTTGYVYVLDRSPFVKKNESEWICHKEIIPIATISIIRSDFTLTIEMMEAEQS